MEIKETTDISNIIYRDAMSIRIAVFVQEQGVPEELERDKFDGVATHFVGYENDKPVSTVRVKIEGTKWHVQRVATLKEARGKGYARMLMEEIIRQSRLNDSISELILGAQLTAMLFYEKLGFTAVGPEFLDAGILHREMELEVK